LHDVQALVTKVLANEVLLIVRTRPGSASLVAAHIDGLNSRDILGSIAGDDTVFVAPRSTKDMARAKARLVALLDRQSLV
jgi:transcriptional regulator of arginine metabolism